jgi:selenocysteine-specific elongation factor
MNKHFILVTAGHVDHGKSSLVKTLTGIDPDRLPEEKARGITIELGFAYFDLVAPNDPGSLFRVGIVDVPGHEDFVKNMVAGVGPANVALLVVAADDGWMPQTEEHLEILLYLGVSRLVVALTKTDLLTVNLAAVTDAVRQQLSDTPFPQAPIVSVSVVSGQGIDELKSTLAATLSQTPEQRDYGKPRLAVDRAFVLHGIGTVVTGTLTGGTLSVGQAVVIQPTEKKARIRSIQSHNQNLPSIGPGTRTALNLSDVAVTSRSGSSPESVWRGDLVTLTGLGQSVRTLDVLLARSPRLLQHKTAASRALKDGTIVRVHLGTGNWTARLLLLDRKEAAPGENCIARLCLENSIFAFVDDRIIIRDSSEQATLAGGIVLANDGGRRSFGDPARRAFLERCVAAVENLKARVAAQIAYVGIARRCELLVQSHASAEEIERETNSLVMEGKVVGLGALVTDSDWWTVLKDQAICAIDTAHRAYPERVGLPLSELRSTLKNALGLPETFEALLTELSRQGFTQVGTDIKRLTHRPALPPRLQATGAKLRAALALKPLEPPSRNELAQDATARQALQFLIDTGEVVEIGPDAVMTHESFSRVIEVIKAFLGTHSSATVSELRQAVGTTRRIIVPLLEGLDRTGVTSRRGDQRVLRNASPTTLPLKCSQQ